MYRFETIYTKDNIKILTRVQVHTYYWKSLLVMFLLGIFLVGISVTCTGNRQVAILLTAAGCWLCISTSYPVQYLTKRIHKKMGDDNRKFSYMFDQNNITIENGSDRNCITYNQIQKIVETKGEFCVFLTRHSGLLLSKANLRDQHAADVFKALAEECTGLKIEQEQALFLRLMKLRLIKR